MDLPRSRTASLLDPNLVDSAIMAIPAPQIDYTLSEQQPGDSSRMHESRVPPKVCMPGSARAKSLGHCRCSKGRALAFDVYAQ
jgi:hypothetical protein